MAEPGADAHEAAGRRAWAGLLQVHAALVPMLDKELQRETGLPLAWYDVLLELNAAEGGRLRMGELGHRVVLSRTRVSRLVEELSRSGLVWREVNPDDRRSAFAVLTDTGRQRLRDAAPTYMGGIREHFSRHLEPSELTAVGDALWQVHHRATGQV
ncbi:MAG: MarR family winged helix-turn-helix transcriptional regulator [Acidimicrobiales bacterium]